MRGFLQLIESALRLLGGANATGLLAAGVAYHAFVPNPPIQGMVKWAATSFSLGVISFVAAYGFWVFTALEIDLSLHVPGEKRPEYALTREPDKSPDEYRRRARRYFILTIIAGLAALVSFCAGLVIATELIRDLK